MSIVVVELFGTERSITIRYIYIYIYIYIVVPPYLWVIRFHETADNTKCFICDIRVTYTNMVEFNG